MPTIQYGTTSIDYCHYIEDRKDVRVSVDLINGVEVYTPEHLEQTKLDEILKKKARWISEKLEALDEVKAVTQPKEMVSGEKLPYLGRNYRIKIYKDSVQSASLKLKQGRFVAIVPDYWTQEMIQQQLDQHFKTWYREHGLKKMLDRKHHYESLLGVESRSFQLRTQHKRWGTCTPNGDIYINWRLAMAPVHVIDYVIVHELAHLIVAEHNDQFWKIVKSTLPDYEASKEWLRVHGTELHTID
ncbi:M48 family metallopeptidase [Alkalibacillus salilacus]|uniref:Metal-dependent hydrolase n=1 Tax=Alkalibacillus salilacus TaxID=284582 RepID=A0ABT9VGE2_9BACI|nr:SprT family zinc-dependent metalloprotease [Alkalibacillus salilacus]MDQ0160021.1 putative metal-dependent hydrolase [Alkalibacillus salilacus]